VLSSFAVVTSVDPRIFGSVILGVFYPCLVSCNCTSFTYCLCLKSYKDRGCSVLRCEVFAKGVSKLCGIQSHLFVVCDCNLC